MNRIKPVVPALMLLAASFLLALLTSTALAQHEDNSVCPLSDDQTQKSIQSFDKVANVFTQQPRCVNCHGAVDPFGPDAEDKHGGGKLDPIMKTEPDSNTGESVTVQDDEATFGQCRTCHDAFSRDWHIPPAALSFVGKDAITLCKGQKDFFNFDGGAFLKHIEQDVDSNNPFIQEAFTGRMGLNDVGQSLANKYPDPPNGVTHQDLIQMAHDWVDAQGGKFRGNLDCGCVPKHYALKIKAEEGVSNPAGLQGTFKGQANFQIPIKFKEDGSFTGETQVNITYSGTVKDQDSTCTTTMVVNGQTWGVTGQDNDDDKTLHIKLTVKKPAAVNKGTCTSPDGTVAVSANIPAGEASTSLDMPALVGEMKPVMMQNQYGGFDNVQFTVVETSTP